MNYENDDEDNDIKLEFTDEQLEAANVLSKEILSGADSMTKIHARRLTDTYYMYQHERLSKEAQVKEAKKAKEPTTVIEHFRDAAALHEIQAGKLLERFAKQSQAGRWALSQKGVGGVITAGLLGNIYMAEAVSPSHMISHAGLNPNQQWGKGEERPFNVKLKTLTAFKMGECFVKVQGREDAFYGDLFTQFKDQELERNDFGDNVARAEADAKAPFKGADGKMRNGIYGPKTKAWGWVNACYPAGACAELADISELPLPDEIMILEGKKFTEARNAWRAKVRIETLARLKGAPGSGQAMLPPAQVHARARRRVVKVFLQHFWEELFVEYYNQTPPEPYVFAHMDHFHKIERPNPTLPDPSKPALDYPRIPRSRMPGYKKPKRKPKKEKFE